MSMASPTLRSSSRTLPWPSCSNWATERLARPSTAEMFTGTSKTGARSVAIFSSSLIVSASGPSPWANSSSFSSSEVSGSGVSDMAWLSGLLGVWSGGSAARDQGFGVQALGGERRVQGLGDAVGGGGGIEARRAVAEVEGEGVRADAGRGADLDRAWITHSLGGLFQHGLQPLQQLRLGGDDQARRGLDLAGQR